MNRPTRIGLVGCGRLAEAGYVPAAAVTGDVVLAAVADPDPVRRAAVATAAEDQHMSVTAHADAAALLAGAGIDALVLATPAAHHVADAAAAVAAGIPVLVEKPPAPDADGAAELVALGPSVRVAFNRRFDPGAQAVRRSLPAGRHIELDLELSYRRASWGAVSVQDEVLLDLVPHLIDWARWLLGSQITEVSAATLTHDLTELGVDLGRGRARIAARADAIHRERIEARDASGALLARHRTGGVAGMVTGRLRRGPHPLVASLAAQLEAFSSAVRGRPDAGLLGTAADGLAVMTAVDAARASAAAGGRPVPVPDPVEAPTC